MRQVNFEYIVGILRPSFLKHGIELTLKNLHTDFLIKEIIERFSTSFSKISNWNEIEEGLVDEEEILVFMSDWEENDEIIIITDEDYQNRKGFELTKSNLTFYMSEVYPEIHKMDFLQPSDYIIFNLSKSVLLIINHEGVVFKQQF